jgi:hypothetical protein
VQSRTWRNAGLPMGKHSFSTVGKALNARQRTERLGAGMVTRAAATGTPRGAWSRGQRGQKRPSKWCSGEYG